jgi:hypothetical protein
MAFKQGNNPISRKASPMRMSPFKKQEPSMSMDELKKMSAAQDAASKAQADKLPQIEKPGFDYEMDQDMSYPGGERGRDYDEDGLKDLKKDGMSRKSGSYLSDADVKRKQKKADKKFSKVSDKNSDKKNLRKAKAGLKVEGQIVDKEIKDRKKNNKS